MLLLTPGPVQTRPEVRAAMACDIAPWDMDFRAEYEALRHRITRLAGGDPATHATLPLQGAGHFLVEAAIRSFLPPGGRLLVLRNGTYADRILRLARDCGRDAVALDLPDTEGADPESVKRALAADAAVTHLGIVQSETGSGIVNDVAALGAAARAAGKRVILDSVSAFGALPFDFARSPEVDAVLFTSNKCIEGLPGFGFAVSPIARLEACEGNAQSWSLDLTEVYRHALKNGFGSLRFTGSAQALRAFGVAMDLYEAEGGQPARLARYAENARILYDGLLAAGFRPYLARANQGPIIVTAHQPEGFDLQAFVDALKARGVLISNFYTTPTPSIRIGCIGAVSNEEMRFAVAQIAEVARARLAA